MRCVRRSVLARPYVGVVPHVVDDALQHRGQRHHGVSAPPVDGLVRLLATGGNENLGVKRQNNVAAAAKCVGTSGTPFLH